VLDGTSHGTVRVFEDVETAVKNAWLIIECVPEQLPVKIDTFAELEQKAPKDAILSTNSSSYKSRDMLAKIGPTTAMRTMNMHWMMPRE